MERASSDRGHNSWKVGGTVLIELAMDWTGIGSYSTEVSSTQFIRLDPSLHSGRPEEGKPCHH